MQNIFSFSGSNNVLMVLISIYIIVFKPAKRINISENQSSHDNPSETLRMLRSFVVFHQRGGKCGQAEAAASVSPTGGWTERRA